MSSNRAAAFLALELWQDALVDAERARVLSEAALKRSPKTAGPAYVKTFALKGAALMGARRLPEHVLMLQNGTLSSERTACAVTMKCHA